MKRQVEGIIAALARVHACRITVFGDFCLDKYLYIDPARDEPSVETGLTAYQAERRQLYPGAGGTVANNLRALGAQVRCIGLMGVDGEGFELTQALGRVGADTSLMVQSDSIMTGTYIKPMRRQPDGSYLEMSRIDIRNFSQTPDELQDRLLANVAHTLADADGVMVLEQFVEQNCSVVTARVREALGQMAGAHPGVPFFADSRGFAAAYRGMIIKCNQFELPGISQADAMHKTAVVNAGLALSASRGAAVVVTLGAEGAYVFEDGQATPIPPFKVTGPLDIVGAGDATDAGIIVGLSLGLSLPEAVTLGCCVASITIQQIGVTGTAIPEQVRQRLLDGV